MLKHSTNPSNVNSTNGKLRNSFNSLNNTVPLINNKYQHVQQYHQQQQDQSNNNSNNNSNEMCKNGRSSSLPLKIIINKNGTSEKLIKSWNGDSSASLISKYLDHLHNHSSNTTNGKMFLPYKYHQLSLSEHYLNLIEEENIQQSIKNLRMLATANNNKNRLIKLNYNINNFNNHLRQNGYFNLINDTTKKLDSKTTQEENNKLILNDDLNENHINKENDKNNNIIKQANNMRPIENNISTQINENSTSLTASETLECSNNYKDDIVKCNEAESDKYYESSTNNSNDLNKVVELDQICSPSIELSINNISSLNDHNETLTQDEQQPTEITNDLKASQSFTSENLSSNNETSTPVTNNNNSLENSSTSLDSTNSSSGVYSDQSDISKSNATAQQIEEAVSESLNATSDTTILDDNLSESTSNLPSSNTNDIEEAIAEDEELSSLYEEELEYRKFLPKKSCLASKSKLFIDITGVGENNDLSDSTIAATSSPLIPTSPVSPNFSSISSTSTINSSELNSTTNTTSSSSTSSKKRVLFADTCGKELFTVRTMNEPSNCPPKLMSKIVQYFLNREFDRSNSLTRNNSNEFNSYNSQYPTQNQLQLQMQSNSFFSTRNYDYGISGLSYSNDSSSQNLKGSIAFYSLNFAQPAADYLKFKQRLDNNFVSLENVLLNSFKINGTIKVKNNNYHKYVFVRCTFNNWLTYEDVQTQFVSYDFYSSPNSTSSLFYSGHNYHHEPVSSHHKEHDTFRFEFQLPKTVNNQDSNSNSNKENVTGSIQFCICFRSGCGDETKEYWDSNDGKNYEILQYVIDLDHKSSTASASSNKQTNNGLLTRSSKSTNFFKFDINNYKSNGNKSNNFINNINMSNNYMPAEEIYY